ncbi:MAG: glycine dehydrogenase (aminomethyl-transferring), partial [Natronospirillum sp.]
LANASLLDEATAAAEAMAMAKRANRKNHSAAFFVSDQVFSQTLDVLRTRAHGLGLELIVGPAETALKHDVFGALLQYPGRDGVISDHTDLIAALHDRDALVAVATDPLALVLLKSPGAMGADMVLGNSQRFGVPMGFGGPHAAFFACRDEFKRAMPGRIIGVSIDQSGKPALRMALQTREQHIRREKANSNICTAQVLLANMAGFYAVYHGPERLKAIAERVHQLTHWLADQLSSHGFTVKHAAFFDTLTIDVGDRLDTLLDRADSQRINLRIENDHTIGIALDETTSVNDLAVLTDVLTGSALHIDSDQDVGAGSIPKGLRRTDAILTHPVFNSHHSETAMLRYLSRL